MTPKQQRIIFVLATANIVIVAALVWLVAHPTALPFPSSPTPTYPRSSISTATQQACQWQAAQLLAQAGLGGMVTLIPDDSLRFEITYPLTPGQAVDMPAQAVWTAFDVSLALQEDDTCAIFSQVKVAVLAHGSQADTRIDASVSTADLRAFDAGELSEAAFIEHVAYRITTNE